MVDVLKIRIVECWQKHSWNLFSIFRVYLFLTGDNYAVTFGARFLCVRHGAGADPRWKVNEAKDILDNFFWMAYLAPAHLSEICKA